MDGVRQAYVAAEGGGSSSPPATASLTVHAHVAAADVAGDLGLAVTCEVEHSGSVVGQHGVSSRRGLGEAGTTRVAPAACTALASCCHGSFMVMEERVVADERTHALA
jgi:hypothetical protein